MRYLLTLLLTGAGLTGLQAQIYNTGILHIDNGIMLSSNGSFTNTSTADFLNNGQLTVSGNIINDQPNLPAGTGVLVLNGTSPQTLGGAADFRCFTLTLNNAQGLTLSRRLGIGDGTGGSLIFTAGRITTGTNTQDVYFYPGSGYTGFDATHHVSGFVTKSGSTDFDFPIGDGTHVADLALTGLSGAADFQVIYAASPYSTFTAASPLSSKNIFTKEWWDVTRVTGTATAKVTLKWNDARKTLNHVDPANLVVAHFTAGAWRSEGGSSADGAGSSTGSIGPSNDIASFSPFTIGSTTASLPITLGAFTAVDKDCHALLSWHTMMEDNATGFEIQQSANGIDYAIAANVPARGSASDYAATVTQNSRTAYYRLRMIDLDGASVFSPVTSLQLNCISNDENLDTYPNPAQAGVQLTVKLVSPVDRSTAFLQVFDMTGRAVYGANVQVHEGVNSYAMPTSGLAQGTYTVIVSGSGWKSPHAYFLLRRN